MTLHGGHGGGGAEGSVGNSVHPLMTAILN